MKTINVGIIAHADAGKTTITEKLLYESKTLRNLGSVDKGTAQTDALKVEQDRGISVKISSAVINYGDTRINIIDTPGHSDFLSEVERGLSVLDYAVLVVSSVEGIQAQTEVLLAAIRDMSLPVFVFINKIDRLGSRSAEVFTELKKTFNTMGREIFLFNTISDEGGDNATAIETPLYANEELILATESDALIEEFLEKGEVNHLTLEKELIAAVSSCKLIPVITGSSKLSIGINILLSSLNLFSSEYESESDGFCARVFKIDWDPIMGKGAHIRIFAGDLKNRQVVYNIRTDEDEKCSAMRLSSGRKLTDISSATHNEIAVVYGLSNVRAGDTLGHGLPRRKMLSVAHPLLSVKVEPNYIDELPILVKALSELSDEDPLLDFDWIPEKRELRIKISGKIQIEILALTLLERYGISVSFSPPSVIYKETPKTVGEGFDAYTMPKPCWAVLRFEIEPLPRGSGLKYESIVPNKNLLYRYQNHVETAVPRALKQGLHGWEVTDLKVTLIDGEHHHIHTHPLDFFLCTPLAIMNGLQNTGTNLLEPYYRICLSSTDDHLGKTIGMVLDRRGVFDTPIMENGKFSLVAIIPVAESIELPADFAIFTGGRGSYTSRFSHYDICPENIIVERERVGVNPLDRPRYILEQRSALAGK